MKRNERMDIVKGLTIILMIIGHSGFPYTEFIYLFHMAIFFMVSGCLFSFRKITTIHEFFCFVWKKIKGIWWPYFLWNVIYTVLNNIYVYLGVYSREAFVALDVEVSAHSVMGMRDIAKNIIKGIFMCGRTEMGGAFWFLRTLFGVVVLFGFIDYVLNKIISREKIADVVHLFIALICLVLGYLADVFQVQSLVIPIIFSSYILYYMGYIINKYELMNYLNKWGCVLVGILILVICNKKVAISLGSNSYGNPAYLIVCSIAGWMLIYGLASVLEKFKCRRLWIVLGMNTLPIVIHHFWCFKLVHFVQIALYGYPKKYLAAFPYLNASGAWWVVYTIVGVAVPVIISLVYKKGKEKILGHA